MGRYFFDIVDGTSIPDDVGTECSGMDEVRYQAIATAGGILRDLAAKFPRGIEWQLVVRDESRRTVLRLRFSIEEPTRPVLVKG